MITIAITVGNITKNTKVTSAKGHFCAYPYDYSITVLYVCVYVYIYIYIYNIHCNLYYVYTYTQFMIELYYYSECSNIY